VGVEFVDEVKYSRQLATKMTAMPTTKTDVAFQTARICSHILKLRVFDSGLPHNAGDTEDASLSLT
jgi:hypothetical protein